MVTNSNSTHIVDCLSLYYLPILHVGPLKLFLQVQVKVAPEPSSNNVDTHTPLFLQGLLSQGPKQIKNKKYKANIISNKLTKVNIKVNFTPEIKSWFLRGDHTFIFRPCKIFRTYMQIGGRVWQLFVHLG